MTLETPTTAAPSRNVPAVSPASAAQTVGDAVGRDAVDLRQRHHPVPQPQEREDLQVLAGLRHDAVVGRHDQDHAVHAAGSGHHGLDEAFVAGHVDDAHLEVGDGARGVAQVDGHAPLLLLLEPVGFAAGERLDQGRLAVVDVPRGAERDIDLRDWA